MVRKHLTCCEGRRSPLKDWCGKSVRSRHTSLCFRQSVDNATKCAHLHSSLCYIGQNLGRSLLETSVLAALGIATDPTSPCTQSSRTSKRSSSPTMAMRVIVYCKTTDMPGKPNESIAAMTDIICQTVWGRPYDVACDRQESYGGHFNKRCVILIDNGPVDAREQKMLQFKWQNQDLYFPPYYSPGKY